MKTTLHYISRSGDNRDGTFGTALECAEWYLRYDGADYRVSPKTAPSYDDDGELLDEAAQVDTPWGLAWEVYFRDGRGNWDKRSAITVYGHDEAAALVAVQQDMLDRVLMARFDGDLRFSMRPALFGVKDLLHPSSFRQFYAAAGQPATDDLDTIKDWFFNADLDTSELLRMVDLVAAQEYSPLSAAMAAQIKGGKS